MSTPRQLIPRRPPSAPISPSSSSSQHKPESSELFSLVRKSKCNDFGYSIQQPIPGFETMSVPRSRSRRNPIADDELTQKPGVMKEVSTIAEPSSVVPLQFESKWNPTIASKYSIAVDVTEALKKNAEEAAQEKCQLLGRRQNQEEKPLLQLEEEDVALGTVFLQHPRVMFRFKQQREEEGSSTGSTSSSSSAKTTTRNLVLKTVREHHERRQSLRGAQLLVRHMDLSSERPPHERARDLWQSICFGAFSDQGSRNLRWDGDDSNVCSIHFTTVSHFIPPFLRDAKDSASYIQHEGNDVINLRFEGGPNRFTSSDGAIRVTDALPKQDRSNWPLRDNCGSSNSSSYTHFAIYLKPAAGRLRTMRLDPGVSTVADLFVEGEVNDGQDLPLAGDAGQQLFTAAEVADSSSTKSGDDGIFILCGARADKNRNLFLNATVAVESVQATKAVSVDPRWPEFVEMGAFRAVHWTHRDLMLLTRVPEENTTQGHSRIALEGLGLLDADPEAAATNAERLAAMQQLLFNPETELDYKIVEPLHLACKTAEPVPLLHLEDESSDDTSRPRPFLCGLAVIIIIAGGGGGGEAGTKLVVRRSNDLEVLAQLARTSVETGVSQLAAERAVFTACRTAFTGTGVRDGSKANYDEKKYDDCTCWSMPAQTPSCFGLFNRVFGGQQQQLLSLPADVQQLIDAVVATTTGGAGAAEQEDGASSPQQVLFSCHNPTLCMTHGRINEPLVLDDTDGKELRGTHQLCCRPSHIGICRAADDAGAPHLVHGATRKVSHFLVVNFLRYRRSVSITDVGMPANDRDRHAALKDLVSVVQRAPALLDWTGANCFVASTLLREFRPRLSSVGAEEQQERQKHMCEFILKEAEQRKTQLAAKEKRRPVEEDELRVVERALEQLKS